MMTRCECLGAALSSFVTTGLDPVVHTAALYGTDGSMDCRVKPGNDEAHIGSPADNSDVVTRFIRVTYE